MEVFSLSELRISGSEEHRTRRNMLRMAAILGSAAGAAALAKVSLAHATIAPPKCLLRGTSIQTAIGERKVEELAIGDLLPTVFGGVRPIQWIGRYPMKKSDSSRPWVKTALPVRVAHSALAPDLPHSDLYVTGGHALLIDGLLLPAGTLINGTTIRHQDMREDELEFFHIKMVSHDAVYAEGTSVETILSVDESAVNFAE
jgi:hypothetical protein